MNDSNILGDITDEELRLYSDLIADSECTNGTTIPAWQHLPMRNIKCPACEKSMTIPNGISALRKCPHCKNNVLFHDGRNNYVDMGRKALND